MRSTAATVLIVVMGITSFLMIGKVDGKRGGGGHGGGGGGGFGFGRSSRSSGCSSSGGNTTCADFNYASCFGTSGSNNCCSYIRWLMEKDCKCFCQYYSKDELENERFFDYLEYCQINYQSGYCPGNSPGSLLKSSYKAFGVTILLWFLFLVYNMEDYYYYWIT